jgi:transcriptional regulator NrdR family protein
MHNQAIDVVKRNGSRPSELFQRTKLHASIRAACLSVRSPEGEAEMTAKNVCDIVVTWLETKPEVTSNDLRRKATEALEKFHPEAAYLYKHHRLVI